MNYVVKIETNNCLGNYKAFDFIANDLQEAQKIGMDIAVRNGYKPDDVLSVERKFVRRF